MDLQNHLLRGQQINSLAVVLGAMLCFASTSGIAADRATDIANALSQLSRVDTGLKLKMDLGLTQNGEECEDDTADMSYVPISGSSAGASLLALASASGGDTMPAKLNPTQNTFTSAKLGIGSESGVDAGSRSDNPSSKNSIADKPASLVAAGPVATAVPESPAQSPWFIAPADKTLNTALARWAAAAGWQLLWELPVDYSVDTRTEIRGSFVDAIGLVAKSMETAEVPMKAIFYEGNRVLRIVAKGSE